MWAEVGNSFVYVYVGPDFGCKYFEPKTAAVDVAKEE